MKQLAMSFLKIYFRNRRGMFFIILLPALIYLVLALLRFERVIQFDLGQSYADFLLPGVIGFAVMQTGIYTAAYSLIDYRKQSILKRLAVTPLTAGQFLFSQGLARFIVAILQSVLLLLLGVVIFGAELSLSVVLSPAIILIGSIIFLNFGSIIASLSRDYEEAAPYTAVVGLVSSGLGDAFFPVANFPSFLQKVADILPMKPFVAALRFSFFGAGAEQFPDNLIVLLIWLVASIWLAKIIFSRQAYH